MTQQMVSRSQRRMEKKQTLFTVSMLLVVALISFSLGVMVGRSGDQNLVAEERLPAQQPVAVTPGRAADSEGAGTPGKTQEAEPVQQPQLTFYDTLAAGQQNALGSGINLAPEPIRAEPQPESLSSPPVSTGPEKVQEKVGPTVTPVPSAPAAPKPAAVVAGNYLVQVAAVKDLPGAEGLRDRMKKQGYEAFVEKVDLGAKGIWYRVYAGPFGSRKDADLAVQSLKADRISSAPLVRQR